MYGSYRKAFFDFLINIDDKNATQAFKFSFLEVQEMTLYTRRPLRCLLVLKTYIILSNIFRQRRLSLSLHYMLQAPILFIKREKNLFVL